METTTPLAHAASGNGNIVSQNIATPDNNNNNNDDEHAEKRKRQPRNSACQGCAALKMKCISQPNGKCERCNRMDRDCIPAIPKPRKRRTQSNVGESEGIPLLEFAAGPSTPQVLPPKFHSPASSTQTQYQREAADLLSRNDLSHTGSKSFVSLFSRGLGNIAACEELLTGIDYNFVAKSFTIYRQLTPRFPFVELSTSADPATHVASRPVLTLAICTVASIAHPDVQLRLSQAFRYALSSKVILGSERSLDLLTGVLVFLAWHHQYMSEHYVYQQLWILASMAADQGLYASHLKPFDPARTLERDRAFLGCYYVSSTLSAVGFDKPNPLRWTPNLRICAGRAASSGSLHSDRTLMALLELAHAIDDMEDGLRQLSEQDEHIPSHFIELHTKTSNQRLKAIRREHQSIAGHLIFPAASIHIYQRSLRSNTTPDSSTLIQCTCAIKDFVDDLVARPPATLHQISIVDWTYFLEMLLLMARIAKPSSSAVGWESGALREMLQPETLLDSVYNHMAAAPKNDPLSPRSEPLLQWLRSICHGIKKLMQSENGGRQRDDAFDSFGNAILESAFLKSLS